MDLSYLAISDAVSQLDNVLLDGRADLVALIKPTFELRRPTVAASDDDISEAIARAARAITDNAWQVLGRCDAPVTGRRGAREAFLYATRRAADA
jgi:predicted rRNA methylase YqxC with S4 and FtsJ domains